MIRILDVCCGAGGASRGYADAGLEVGGVDCADQPAYPYPFHRGDALDAIRCLARDFDAIHASFPCQPFTAYRRKGHGVGDGYPDLIARGRDLLEASGKPYVIENVPGAPLRDPVTLCGSSFGLDVRRHRLFEANFPIPALACRHELQTPRFPPATNRTNLRSTVEVGVWRIPLSVQRDAMGIDWMSREELSQAVPPAYTAHVGAALLAEVRRREALRRWAPSE